MMLELGLGKMATAEKLSKVLQINFYLFMISQERICGETPDFDLIYRDFIEYFCNMVCKPVKT